ncbi:unnamed protein product [Lasius platythorax]|uniref:Cell division control protein n=1 Tax=Lasius platythorax TaxID=488582 RepID=A0AAV2NFB1_9HYME
MSQTTIPFLVRKRCSFYGRKEDVAKEDFANATARHTPSKYTPTVKKVVTLTSSESESDSDIENTTEERRRMNDDRRTDSSPRSRHRKCNDLDEQHSLSPPKQRRNESQGRNNFYDRKEDVAKKDFENTTARHTPSKNTRTVKKVVTLTSSESDSDIENTTEERRRMNDDKRTDSSPRSRHRKCNYLDEQHFVSPPKQRRNESQGRNKSPLTPSTLLGKLDLSVTKKGKLDPKQLFKSHLSKEEEEEEEDELNSNLLFGSNKYQNARKALHSSETEELPGREEELAKLQEFFQRHLEGRTSGSLYVSGPPGTGKTATLFKIMRQSDLRSKVKIVYINCTSMKSAAAIYAKIIQATIGATKSGKNGKAVIERYLTSKSRTLLLVLDEIDQLESKKQSVLYSIFEWPSLPNSNLILVGIANALDLTDRILPRLQARCELKPMLMHFAPYTKQQIFDIISARLNQANANGIFTPSAIQLLAGKVAAISGDIRRALDISRRVVELAESHQVAQVLRPTNDNDTNIESLKHETEITEKPVDLKEVVTILNGVYGGTQNIDQEQDSFPLQQKLLLCSLLLILNKGRNKDVTVGKLHEVYKKVCKKRNIFAVDVSEFVNLCSLIETRGILRVVGRKEARLCKVNLQWDQEELDAALQDKQMMADIINDTSCL